MQRLPPWLVFLLFVPLQIWLMWKIFGAWGFWKALGFAFLVGVVATRAARANGLRAWLFPGYAERWEERRHVFQGILLLAAAATFYFAWGPQPWVPVFVAATAVKAAVR